MAILVLSLILGAISLLYLYLTRNYKFWQKNGIPCMDGVLPGIGNMLPVVTARATIPECCRRMYNIHKNRSMVGFYNFSSPTLIVRELELVKTVLQTNFSNFHENAFKIDRDLDPLLAKNPFFCDGDEWATGRKRLTYAFSSMRLKILLETVKQVNEKFEKFLNENLSNNEKFEVKFKDLFSKFTGEVVASAAFGVEGHCFEKGNEHVSFQKIGASILDLESKERSAIWFILVFFFPWISKVFGIRVLSKDMDRFFKKLVADVMEHRRTDGIPRKDFLQLMVELEKMEGDKFNLDDLTSAALSFFVDGFETSSIVLSFVGYQLAVHTDIQQKLREEIVSVLNKHDGKITYDGLKDMTYMDQVLNESQRIIPTVGIMNKICTEEFELKGSDGLVCRVKPGMEMVISVHGLHADPQYWVKPEVFDPDRFSPDNKQNIEKFAFLPFGEGPRMCVGMRMALLQMKACLTLLLSKYSLELSPKTQLPLEMVPNNFMSTAKGGLWGYIRHL